MTAACLSCGKPGARLFFISARLKRTIKAVNLRLSFLRTPRRPDRLASVPQGLPQRQLPVRTDVPIHEALET